MTDKVRYVLDVDDKGSPKLVKFGATAEKSSKKAASGFAGAGKAVGDFGQQIPGVGGMMSSLAGGPMVAVGAAAVAVAAGLGAIVASTLKTADHIGDLSQQLGVSTESLSALSHMANLSGTDLEAVAKGMGKLGAKIADGDKTLKAYGLTAGSADEALYQIADRIKGTQDPMMRLKIATDAFGKSGKDMIPMLLEGEDGLRRMADAAPIYSTEMVAAAQRFNDQMDDFKGRIAQIGIGITSALLPQLEAWADGLDKIRKAMGFISEAEQRQNAERQIKAKFADAKAQRNQYGKSGADFFDKISGQVRIDGKTESETIAALAPPVIAPPPPPPPDYESEEDANKRKAAADKARADAKRSLEQDNAIRLQMQSALLQDTQALNESAATNEFARRRIAAQNQYQNDLAALDVQFAAIKTKTIEDQQALNMARLAAAAQYDAELLVIKEDGAAKLAAIDARIAEQEAAVSKARIAVVQAEAAQQQAIWASLAGGMESAMVGPLQEFGNSIFDQNKDIADSFQDLFSGIAEGFANMLTQMLAQMAARAAIFALFSAIGGPAAGAVGSSMSNFVMGKHALGTTSPVVGMPAMVGERRPEIIIPQGPQRIEPTASQGPGITIVVQSMTQAESLTRRLKNEKRRRDDG